MRAETLIAEAAEGGTDLIVFPEVWLSGYPYWTEGWDSPLQQWAGGRIRFRDAAIVAPSEDTERLGAAARKVGAYVVVGCNEMDSRPELGKGRHGHEPAQVEQVMHDAARLHVVGGSEGSPA